MTKKGKRYPCRTILMLFGLLFAATVSAQPSLVAGSVKDAANGDPIIGANVMVKGSVATGTVTDVDGNFSLSTQANALLEISFMGYKTVVISRENRKTIAVTLEEDAAQLDEVVVIGYGMVRKGDATGSLTSVTADQDMRGFAPNAQDMLVGKVAGVNITTAGGSPTGGATIRIRGGSSLSASNDPLIVVDGVYMENSGVGGVGNILSSINPNDIESFTVLKDASATAIYGSRASNGVLLITTKKGSDDKVSITYDGSVSFSMLNDKLDAMDGTEYKSFIEKSFSGASNEAEVLAKLGYYDSEGNHQYADTDWQDEIFRTAVNTEHNISALGSFGQKLPYRFSLGYTNNNGVLKTSKMERYTANFALNPSLFDKHLKININGKGMYMKSHFANQGAIGAAISMDPTKPVYDETATDETKDIWHRPNGQISAETHQSMGGYWSWIGADGNLIKVATTNPLSMIDLYEDSAEAYNFIGSTQFDYMAHFCPDLHFNLNLSLDYSTSEGINYTPWYAPSAYLYGGLDKQWNQERRNSMLDFYAQYARDLNFLNSRFDIMGGYSWQHYWKKGTYDSFRLASLVTNTETGEYGPEVVEDGNDKTENYIVSFFGRLNYSINNKYLVTFTVRNDGSSRFSEDNRWGFFPSAAFAWRISDENFLKGQNVVSDFKLRLGWGVTGQQDINQGDYPYMGSYTKAINNQASYARGDQWVEVIKPNSYNPDLKWEETTTYNIGLDYGFLKNRIYGTVDYYFRKTEDLINTEAKTAAGTNFSEYVVANIGSLENRGFEFSVNGIAIENKDWKWEVGANFAYNQNEITALTFGDNSTAIRRFGSTGGDGSFTLKAHVVGEKSGMYYVYEQIYREDGSPIEGMYVDRNGDGNVDENDLYLHKNATPDFTFGFNTKLTYKNWDFAVNSHGSIGNYNYNSTAANNAEISRARIYANEFLCNRLNSAFDTKFGNKQVLSDYYIQNASFFRIDNVILGYSFKKIAQAKLNGRVFVSVQNPIVFTSYEGLDPEIDGGVDDNFYPRPITIMGGLNLKF